MNKHLDLLLVDWGSWCRKLHRGCLSYPSRTAETRVLEGRSDTPGRGPSVPDVHVPERLVGLDRAIRDMPPRLKLALHIRYLEDLDREAQEELWKQRARQGRRQLYATLEGAHWWLLGRLSNEHE